MFKAVKAATVTDYLKSVPANHKELVDFLHAFIQKAVPKLKPHFASNMLGYGSFPWRNSKKQPIEWPVIALADQKNYVSLYVCSVMDGKYVAETYASELGNVKVGKSCISIKKLEDVHLPSLKKVLILAAKHPGFTGIGAQKK